MNKPDDELALRLRRDARTWDASPSPAARQRLHAAINTPHPVRARRRCLIAAAAAMLIVATGSVLHRPQPPARAPRQTAHLDAALAPLQRELVAVSDDARALVDAVWQGVRRPLLCLVGR